VKFESQTVLRVVVICRVVVVVVVVALVVVVLLLLLLLLLNTMKYSTALVTSYQMTYVTRSRCLRAHAFYVITVTRRRRTQLA